MAEESDRNERRMEVAEGGWHVLWGDLITENHPVSLVSIPASTVGAWATYQINAQLVKFGQRPEDVSDDVVAKATNYLQPLLKYKRAGDQDFDGLGVKVGVVKYHRQSVFKVAGRKIGQSRLQDHHQPYIGIRITKALPPKGALASQTQGVLDFPSVFTSADAGIGGFDFKSSEDRVFAFDYEHSDKLDYLVVYRPGSGILKILKNTDGGFSPVYASPGAVGIGGYDLRSTGDRGFAFDYDHSGFVDHIVMYRPGTGTLWILKNTEGSFTPVYSEGCPGRGIGGFDLMSPDDRAFAFDYDHSGMLDHIALYRPGTGTIWILRNDGDNFTPVYAQGSPGIGIGGYDLQSPNDRAFAFDYEHTGRRDCLAFYRPGTGTIWILKNGGGSFTPVYEQGSPGKGIGGFDLGDEADTAFAYDWGGIGCFDHIVLYRPGSGAIFILKNEAGGFSCVYAEGAPGAGIGGFDLSSSEDKIIAMDYGHSGKTNALMLYRPGAGVVRIVRPT